jgi:hypothetical protein
MADDTPAASGPLPSARPELQPDRPREFRPRSIEQLRGVVSMLCHFIWFRQTRPGEHMWSIPADPERDFDCVLSDAITELEQLRAAVLASSRPQNEQEHLWFCRRCQKFHAATEGLLCPICGGGLDWAIPAWRPEASAYSQQFAGLVNGKHWIAALALAVNELETEHRTLEQLRVDALASSRGEKSAGVTRPPEPQGDKS